MTRCRVYIYIGSVRFEKPGYEVTDEDIKEWVLNGFRDLEHAKQIRGRDGEIVYECE